ncbi:MAG: sulfotransferase family protein [Caulobacteraceae bacterium]
MPLKVIGSGLGRTGTLSLKHALEQLGFGPCHHMIEVFGHPESVPLWIAAGKGTPDWDLIFKDYAAAVDYPSAAYWRELTAHYPEAKVVHTTRSPESWYESTQATIFAPGSFADNPPPHIKAFFDSFTGPFAGRLHDRDLLIEHFRRHEAEVQATIASERLLVMQIGEGWERLCAFLGVPVPDTPYPTENSRQQFAARVSSVQSAAAN